MEIMPAPTQEELSMYSNLWGKRKEGDQAIWKETEAKQPRLAHTSKWKGNRGKDSRANTGSASSHQMDLINMMSRLVLRHEDAISLSRESGLLPVPAHRGHSGDDHHKALFETSKMWKADKNARPLEKRHPLRVVMFRVVLQELESRMTRLVSSEELKALNKDGLVCWNYLEYDPALKKEKPSSPTVRGKTPDHAGDNASIPQLQATCGILRGRSAAHGSRGGDVIPEDAGMQIPQGPDAAIPIGSQTAGDDQALHRSRFLACVLMNPVNRCYQNSVLLSLWWLHISCAHALPGWLHSICSRVTLMPRTDLRNDTEWQAIICAWL